MGCTCFGRESYGAEEEVKNELDVGRLRGRKELWETTDKSLEVAGVVSVGDISRADST